MKSTYNNDAYTNGQAIVNPQYRTTEMANRAAKSQFFFPFSVDLMLKVKTELLVNDL